MREKVLEVSVLLDLNSLPRPEKECTALKLVKDGKGPLECLNPMSGNRHFIRLRNGHITVGVQDPSSCPFYKIYSSLHIHVVKCSVFSNHSIMTIICTESSLDKFYSRLDELGVDYRLISVKRLSSNVLRRKKITTNQLLTLFAAHSLGYFESPSKASIRDVAAILNKSPSTVSELIKKGIKNLIDIIKEKKDLRDLLNFSIGFPRPYFLMSACVIVNTHQLLQCILHCSMTASHMIGL